MVRKKIYREAWKFESGILEWKMCRNPESCTGQENKHIMLRHQLTVNNNFIFGLIKSVRSPKFQAQK